MIDSHCHLNDDKFKDDLSDVLQRMSDAQVKRAVVVGYDIPSSRRAIELAQTHSPEGPAPHLFAAVGLSTHEAASWSNEIGEEIIKSLSVPGVVALGETGLDYFYPTPSKEDQEKSLVAQLEIATEAGVPVVFHLRDAADDFFRILDREGFSGGGVLHCFTGDERAMDKGVDRGFFISFSGIVTFKRSEELRKVAARTPIEKLLVETDAPYLAPVPHRGKRCEPSHVVETARVLSELKEMNDKDFEQQMEENLINLFPRILRSNA